MSLFKKFLEHFPPSENLEKPTQEELAALQGRVPAFLLDFWQEYGFGNYGNGIIKIVNPFDYYENLQAWLGRAEDDFSRTPIVVTGFGDIFYTRTHDDGVTDVSIFDLHYREIAVCENSVEEFFEEYLYDEYIQNEILRRELFTKATEKLGSICAEEIFYFVPALALGGDESLESIDKGDGITHQMLLLNF